jgi:hypothetical protein
MRFAGFVCAQARNPLRLRHKQLFQNSAGYMMKLTRFAETVFSLAKDMGI